MKDLPEGWTALPRWNGARSACYEYTNGHTSVEVWMPSQFVHVYGEIHVHTLIAILQHAQGVMFTRAS